MYHTYYFIILLLYYFLFIGVTIARPTWVDIRVNPLVIIASTAVDTAEYAVSADIPQHHADICPVLGGSSSPGGSWRRWR